MSSATPAIAAPRYAVVHLIARVAIVALLLAVAAIYAYGTIFSRVLLHDDEGYMMLTVKHFLDGAVLYDEVPTAYGPFYYCLRFLIHGVAGVPVSHETFRWVAMGYWFAASGLVVLAVWRFTRRASLTIIAFVATFFYLGLAIPNESGHPQEMVGMLLALIAVIVTWAQPERPWRMAAALGAAAACLTLIKINVGVFATLSLLLALMLAVRGRLARLAAAALVVAAVLLPFALLRHALADTSWRNCAVIVALTIASIAIAAGVAPQPFPARPIRILWAFVLAAVATAIFPIVLVMARGTSVSGMIDVLLLMPARMVLAVSYPSTLAWESVPWAGLSAILAAAHWRQSRRSTTAPVLQFTLAVGKAALGLWLLVMVPWVSPVIVLNVATPFLWLILVSPPSSSDTLGVFPRLALALVAALQILQVYPVPRSQTIFGTLLYLPIEAVCLSDTLDWVERRYAPGTAAGRVVRADFVVVASLLVVLVGWRGYKSYQIYEGSVPLVEVGVSGSGRVRCDERFAVTFQWLIANLARHADTFQSTDGTNSLYFWTGIAPPSTTVVSHSLQNFTDEQQQVIAQALLRSPRTCVIYHASVFRPSAAGPGPPGLLRRMVRKEFKSCGSVSDYDFCVRKGRDFPALVNCVRLEAPGEKRTGIAERTVTGPLLLTAIPGRTASRLSVYDLDQKTILADTQPGGETPSLDIEASASPVRFQSSGSAGLDLSAERSLTLAFPTSDPLVTEHFLVVRLLDRDGRLIKSIPFLKPAVPNAVLAD